MSTANPTSPTYSAVIAPQAITLTAAAPKRGQLDLRAKFGAWLNVLIAKLSSTAYTNPAECRITTLSGTISGSAGSLYAPARGDVIRLASTLTGFSTGLTGQLNGAAAAGDTTIAVDGTLTGLTATNDVRAAILGSATAPGSLTDGTSLTALEFVNIAKTAATPLNLVTLLGNSHVDNEYITNNANTWSIWLPGNRVYDVVIDVNNIAAGTGCAARVDATIYDSDTIA